MRLIIIKFGVLTGLLHIILVNSSAGIPADALAQWGELRITTQWAPREPRQGYCSSLYTAPQDYLTTPKLDINYFAQLIDQFSQVTVGFESIPPIIQENIY